MTRPSQNIDQKLLQAGKIILAEQGISGLQLRRVAKLAKVNPAMIYYHFKNKQDFAQQVMREVYEDFFNKFSLEIETESDATLRLRKAWRVISQYVRNHRQLIIALLRDILNGNRDIVPFMEKYFSRHIKVLIKSVKDCRKQKRFIKTPMPWLFAFMGLNMVGPNIALGILEHVKFNPPIELLKKALIPVLLSDPLIEKRLDLVFKALAPEK
jgi:AcrR family transcriptional regulator